MVGADRRGGILVVFKMKSLIKNHHKKKPLTRKEQLRLLATRLKGELSVAQDDIGYCLRHDLADRMLLLEKRCHRIGDLIIRLARRSPNAGCTLEAIGLLMVRQHEDDLS